MRSIGSGPRGCGIAALAMLALASAAVSEPAPRDTIIFAIAESTSPGDSVFVLGSLPELGGGDLTRAIKLEPSLSPLWRVDVSLPANSPFTYQYFVRGDGPTDIGDIANGIAVSGVGQYATESVDLDPATKTVFIDGGLDPPELWVRQPPGQGLWQNVEMWDVGPAVGAGGERRWAARDFGAAGKPFEFFAQDPITAVPATPTITTALDRVLVRNGEVFTYVPSPDAAPARKDYNPAAPPFIFSNALGQNRAYRVFLPRGYDQHTDRSYPVLYMHDGQNIFDQGTFGTWDADLTAEALVRAGAMRETIIVALDNTADRFRDYTPPDDTVIFGPGVGDPGRADLYAQFVLDELKPIIDATYRTLPDREHTGVLGSSLGGVASLYMGWDFSDRVQRVGAMSGSWWLDEFPERLDGEPWRDLRIYLDVGTAGTSNDGYNGSMDVRDSLLRKGVALEGEVRFRVGIGQEHNEAAWAARLPWAYEFLFPASEAPDDLAHLPTARLGDVNDDGVENLDDLYAFDAGTGAIPDVDRDGVAGAPADRAKLIEIIRAGEAGDLLAGRAAN